MENVTLNPKEQTRLQVLNSLFAEHMTLDQATTLMGVSPRHTRRILAAYREKGVAAVTHGHRGRKPANATSEAVIADVVHLARTRYEGANHTHLSELLNERESIAIGRTTLRRILVNAGLSSPRRRSPPKHRVRRQRMPREGMLRQMDGSHHPWSGNRRPPFALLLAADDATGTVVNAVFRTGEDTRGYFMLLEGPIQRWGIPLVLYGDRHGVFKFSGRPKHIQPPVEATPSAGPWWKWVYSRFSPAHPRPRSLSHKPGALKSIDFLTPIYASKMALSDVFPTFPCRRASKSVRLVLHETRPEAL